MSNPIKDIVDFISVAKSLKIGTVVNSSSGQTTVKISEGNFMNVWGEYPNGSNVYIKDGVILGKIKKENTDLCYID